MFVDGVAWVDSPSMLTDTVARIKDVQSLGLDVGVDFHGRLHKGMAKQLARLLEPHQPLFIQGKYGHSTSLLIGFIFMCSR